VRRRFGGFANGIARGVGVRRVHGTQYMSNHFQKELKLLGIESSPTSGRRKEMARNGSSAP
jgi:hypothetical protein